MVRIIGLTGGIASGKTTTSNILKELGGVIIDADKIARTIVEKGRPALKEIKRVFGEEILLESGELDRKKLGKIVFRDKNLLEKLNKITHPYIIENIINEINWYKKTCNGCVIILDAPLLIEQNLIYLVDEVWLVLVPENIQIDRLLERESISIEDAKRRIDAQMSIEDKKKYADKIIDNSGNLSYLKAQVEDNWKKIIE